jgi:aspartyl-tRNA(Asn)/glutamyl-tRNA(Gln) amidotransferase subunit A
MAPTDLSYLSLHDLAEQLRSRSLSPAEVTDAILSRTEQLEPTLNAYITLMADSALDEAKRAEQEIMVGEYRGPLHGVPVAVKDQFWTKDVRTTAGSALFVDFVPEDDAGVVRRLRDAGAVLLGKTQMAEFALGKQSFGIPRNPWDVDRHPGASSTGSAIALAAGLAYGAVGEDTAGSIRWPSAWCGITGLKPSFGRISTYGCIPLCRDFDHAGPMARSVRDCAHLLDALTGYDPRDPYSIDDAAPDEGWAGLLDAPSQMLRIGVPRDYFWGDLLQPDVRAHAEAALAIWEDRGWTVQEVELPSMESVIAAARTVNAAQLGAEYRELLRDQADLISDDIRGEIEEGLATSASQYLDGLRTWQGFGHALRTTFHEVDLLITPTRAGTAPRIDAANTALRNWIDPVPPDAFRMAFNYPGVPAMSIPCGFDRNGLPIGIQIIGPHLRDDLVLAAGHVFQLATDWHLRRPLLAEQVAT